MRTSRSLAKSGTAGNRHSAATLRTITFTALLLALASPVMLQAQNFVYVTNRTATTNSVSAFAVDAGGVLTSVPGSPFSTGGAGANVLCAAVDRITVSPSRNLLFVANSGDQTISVFSINATTGALTAVAGSPFASGLTPDACAGISLAATPDGNFLMASSNGTIKTFNVAATTGVLTPATSLSGLLTPMVGMKISGDGRFLAVSHQLSVSIFTIASDGSLTAVAGSPFPRTGTGLIGGLEFNCDGTLLYAGEGGATGSITDAWSVGATGSLSPIAGSPFSATGSDSNVVFLTPDNNILLQSNQGSSDLNSFTVNADGTISSIGSFNIAAGHVPAGLSSDNSGLFLYAADDAFGLAVFNIIPGTAPTLVADNPITSAGQVQGVAAFPPRSCAHTDFSISQAASPNPVTAGNQLTYTITITNHGPATSSVSINDLLPRSNMTFVSCAATGGGVCDKGNGLNRTITFASLASGQSGTATIVAATLASLLNQSTISNTSVVSNASAVDPNPADNSSSTSVTVSAPAAASRFNVANATGNYFGTTNLSATLTRTLDGSVVAGRTVTFSLNGTVMGTAITNASGIATLSNVSLVGINAGTYPTGVSVTFGGDVQFLASSGTSILTVNKLPLTVTVQNASKLFGDVNPAFTYVITGFVNNETVAVVSGTANCSTSAGTNSPPGNFPISCSTGTLLATNYSFVFVPATLTVNPAPLVLAANDASRLYGDPNPAFTGTVIGLKSGDQATASFSTTALATSPVGTYPITGTVIPGSGFVASHYSISSTGTLSITPAPLSATATSTSRAYGDPNPAFTGTVTGVKNGDVFTTNFTSTADATSPVGTYPIVASLTGAAATNYTVTTNNGILTVTPAALSVTAANATRLYGDANPAFQGTITGIKNGDNITATYASAADPTSSVGPFSIVPTLADPAAKLGNYTVTSNNGTLTVSPAPLSVTAANANRLYGDPNPAFTGTITGIKNGDNITATFASAADLVSSVGTFPITSTLSDPAGKLANYAVLSTNGILTINPAPLTVTAANASRLYGDPNPSSSGTITGIRNNDNITATFASAATAASAVGTYPITPTLVDPAARLGNYSVTSVNGTLTVNQAPLSVTTANSTRLYGDVNPAFTGTITGLKNSDNITATFSSVATPASVVGNYPITATLVDPTAKLGNYAVTSTDGTLNVTTAPLTVTTGDASRFYGDPNPAFAGTITGLKNGDNITAAYTSTATAASPVGSYPLSATLVDPNGKASNYTVSLNNGTLTVTPAALSVSAANATRAYGDANPVFSGTITGLKNGDNVTATFASSATAASSVGTFTIVSTLVDPTAKLGNYSVTSADGTLTVSAAALNVAAANATRIYGDANPVFSGTITGLKNGDNITATYASAATPASAVGSFAIVPTLADPVARLGNYSVTVNNGTLTVNAAPLTVAAASASRLYGDPNPVFTGTITGLKNGDNITASFAAAVNAASAVGAYPIVPSLADPTAKLGNYAVASSNGTLTINPAPLTVAANNATRLYGDANPAFAGTITGLRNGDAITATFSTAADVASAVGIYPIVPTFSDPGSKLTNYTVASSGTLTVAPAPLTVSAANASRIYGDPNPAFTGTITGLRNADNISATFSSAGPASSVGTYPIVASLADPAGKLGNYSVTSNNGTLTVGPAALTVTAADATRPYGSANPTLTGTITGLKNADNITATFATLATSASAVGSYPIVPSLLDPSAKLGNYTASSVNGTLIVTKATPVMSLDAQAGASSALLTAVVQNAGPTLPSGTVQFSEGGTPLGAAVTIASSSPGATPSASALVSLTPGTHTISASYSGDGTYTTASAVPITVVVGAGTPQFSLSGNGGNTSATVQAGQTATYNISLGSQGFIGSVALTCAGAPAGTSCTVNPASVNLSSTSTSVPITVTVSGTQNASSVPPPFRPTTLFVFAGVVMGMVTGLRKKRTQAVLAVMALFVIGGLTACGGGGNNTTPSPSVKPPTAATLIVTATSGSQTASINLNLTINH